MYAGGFETRPYDRHYGTNERDGTMYAGGFETRPFFCFAFSLDTIAIIS
jgi:hypothetical protein